MPQQTNSAKSMQRIVFIYNLLVSIFWSVVNFACIFIYCYQYVELHLLFWLLGSAAIVYFLPKDIFDKIQLSNRPEIYKKLGVLFIRKFAQEGDLINRLIQKTNPHYKVIQNRSKLPQYIAQTYHFERFHLYLFLFFMMVTVDTLIDKQWGWAIIITINNIVFNVYPNFLQQYNRIRLRKITSTTVFSIPKVP